MVDPQELEWHERVRTALDFKIADPNFVLWIVVQADTDAGLDEEALRRDVESWLGRLDPDEVARKHDEPEHAWQADGLIVRFTAIPKKAEARGTGVPVVGNPVPMSAYRSGVVSSSSRARH